MADRNSIRLIPIVVPYASDSNPRFFREKREALKQLEAEGLVYRIPDRGTFVEKLTMEDIDEVCELRKIFELQALKYSIEKITPQDMENCRQLLGTMENELDVQKFYMQDNSFHKLIAKYCTNQRLMAFLKIISVQIQRLRFFPLLPPPAGKNASTAFEALGDHREARL